MASKRSWSSHRSSHQIYYPIQFTAIELQPHQMKPRHVLLLSRKKRFSHRIPHQILFTFHSTAVESYSQYPNPPINKYSISPWRAHSIHCLLIPPPQMYFHNYSQRTSQLFCRVHRRTRSANSLQQSLCQSHQQFHAQLSALGTTIPGRSGSSCLGRSAVG
jgi:hypothetical protein